MNNKSQSLQRTRTIPVIINENTDIYSFDILNDLIDAYNRIVNILVIKAQIYKQNHSRMNDKQFYNNFRNSVKNISHQRYFDDRISDLLNTKEKEMIIDSITKLSYNIRNTITENTIEEYKRRIEDKQPARYFFAVEASEVNSDHVTFKIKDTSNTIFTNNENITIKYDKQHLEFNYDEFSPVIGLLKTIVIERRRDKSIFLRVIADISVDRRTNTNLISTKSPDHPFTILDDNVEYIPSKWKFLGIDVNMNEIAIVSYNSQKPVLLSFSHLTQHAEKLRQEYNKLVENYEYEMAYQVYQEIRRLYIPVFRKIAKAIALHARINDLYYIVLGDVSEIQPGTYATSLFSIMPLTKFHEFLKNHCELLDIILVRISEKNTSKASSINGDNFSEINQFSGFRTGENGAYKVNNIVINGDINAAANMIRKHLLKISSHTVDIIFDYKKLSTVKRIRYNELKNDRFIDHCIINKKIKDYGSAIKNFDSFDNMTEYVSKSIESMQPIGVLDDNAKIVSYVKDGVRWTYHITHELFKFSQKQIEEALKSIIQKINQKHGLKMIETDLRNLGISRTL